MASEVGLLGVDSEPELRCSSDGGRFFQAVLPNETSSTPAWSQNDPYAIMTMTF
jgi:hypothetical protein